MRTLLAVIAFGLSLLLVWQWQDWPPPSPNPDATGLAAPPAEVVSKPAESPLDRLSPLGEKDEYAAVNERPLFLPDRRPPSLDPEEPPAEDPGLSTDLAGLDLNAVLITPSEASAWIRDPKEKKVVRLRLGDEMAGWSVKEILADRILLERQGERDTLILRDYKNMPPPSPPRQKSTTRKRQQNAKAPRAAATPRRQPRRSTGRPSEAGEPDPD